jgi:hypothetical protein
MARWARECIMKKQELINALSKILPNYVFNLDDTSQCICGVKKLAPKIFRDSKKNLVKSENRKIFISSEMYPDTDKNFRYGLNYTQSVMRDYRSKNWHDYELDKVFVSGKTDEILIEEIKRLFS